MMDSVGIRDRDTRKGAVSSVQNKTICGHPHPTVPSTLPPNPLKLPAEPKMRTAAADGRKAIPTFLCIIIDDHSRLIPFAAYFLRADTQAFHQTLKEALRRRGLPAKLYTDQGGLFTNDHARVVCASLGIRLLHAKPYHAWSKGKAER